MMMLKVVTFTAAMSLLAIVHSAHAQAEAGSHMDQTDLYGFLNDAHLEVRPDCNGLGADCQRRTRRQVTQVGGAQPEAQQPGANMLTLISELPQQVERIQSSMRMLNSIFSPNDQNPQLPRPEALQSGLESNQASSPGSNPLQMLSSLSQVIRATQDSNAKVVSGAQQSAQQTSNQAMEAAKSAQGGIQSALTEIGQGLQRIATNNPNLVPDVKNLFTSVQAKLNSASNSVGQAVNPAPSGAQQFADSVAKAAGVPAS